MIYDTEEYRLGYEWAVEHSPRFAELFHSKELVTPELQTALFKEAGRKWPSKSDSMENELKQTAFVAGAFKGFTERLPMSQDALAAVFDAAMEMGSIWNAEIWKARHLETLKAKPASWWRKKVGAASPNEIAGIMSAEWRRRHGRDKGRKDPRSKWEVLIDTMGTRELSALATLQNVEDRSDSYPVKVLRVEGEDSDFEVIAAWAYTPEGRVYHWPGEIIG